MMAYRTSYLNAAVLGLSILFGECAYKGEVIPAARVETAGPRPPQYAEVFGWQTMHATLKGDGRTFIFPAGLFVEEGDSVFNVRVEEGHGRFSGTYRVMGASVKKK